MATPVKQSHYAARVGKSSVKYIRSLDKSQSRLSGIMPGVMLIARSES